MTRRLAIPLATVAFAAIVGLYFAPGSDLPSAGAQTAPPPTTPCEGCGPSGQPGDGLNAWAFPEHVCWMPTPTQALSTFRVAYGLAKGAPAPAEFQWRTTSPFSDEWAFLGNAKPGQSITSPELVTVQPGQTVLIEVRAVRNGQPIRFGDGSKLRTFTLTCPCDQPTIPTSPVTTPPPGSVPTTAPGTSSTTPPVESTVPGATVTLPPTGGGWAPWAPLGGVLILFGLGLLVIGRLFRGGES